MGTSVRPLCPNKGPRGPMDHRVYLSKTLESFGGFEGGAGSWGEGSGHYDGLGWGGVPCCTIWRIPMSKKRRKKKKRKVV
ncbi:hypothetical protein F4809DRAFT_544641 [Biscogniauxia mediterranea]|nr:hypothetical protein F4809DRAFT_544641 [Biscogniauxia mediterranea]